MSKPQKTVADYMVIALSPALIMALVGSLCFFLIQVFYRGPMKMAMVWVMFWFVIAIVLITRIAIESGRDRAAVFGFCLAVATWVYMAQATAAYFLALLLLGVVWFCAHKLVWDCTLIDELEDSSGQGLLQAAAPPPAPKTPPTKTKTPVNKPARNVTAPQNPGRWVIYFSLAALPLFGVGQMLLPSEDGGGRRAGLIFLAIYLAAALGLLVTTSFLGLRRYLRQRYLKMPPAIALAWLKFGVGVACMVLVVALFLPRPGANEAWAVLRYQINYQLRRASEYASPGNPPGKGEGQPGSDSGGKAGNANQPGKEKGNKPTAGQDNPAPPQSSPPSSPTPPALTGPAASIYNLLRRLFFLAVLVGVGGWIIRRRHLFAAMLRSIIDAIRKWVEIAPRKPKKEEPELRRRRVKFTSFAQYKNPFFTAKDHEWPAEQIVIYSYEAVQVWAKEQGIAARPEETAREFCARLGGQRANLDAQLQQLSRLYAHAAYGTKLPPGSDLEPVRELWRRLPTAGVETLSVAPR